MNPSFADYIVEIRKRIINSLILLSLVLTPLIYYSGILYNQVATPLIKLLPQGSALIATAVVTPFTVPLKLAIVTALFVTMPYIIYQVWKFVAPALYQHEKKFILPLIVLSIMLFYLGVSFAFFVVCPLALSFFIKIAPSNVAIMTDISSYFDFILALMLAFGITFQVPIITVALIKANIVSVETVSKKRPYIIVMAFVIGMLLTPPDVVSQICLAIPLLALFELGLFIAKIKKPPVTTGGQSHTTRSENLHQ